MSILAMNTVTTLIRFRISTINIKRKTKSFLILERSTKKKVNSKINPFLLTPFLKKRKIPKFSILIS